MLVKILQETVRNKFILAFVATLGTEIAKELVKGGVKMLTKSKCKCKRCQKNSEEEKEEK